MHPIPQRLPLAQQVVEILRHGIRDGLWKEHLPGELELSRSLQVSRMTLRAALKTLTREGWLKSSQGRRRRVLEKAVRGRPAPQNRRIVLLAEVPLVRMPSLHMLLVDGLREELAKAGFDLDVHSSPACFSGKPDAMLAKLRRENPGAAWVLLGAPPALQHWFMDQGLPSALIGARHQRINLPSVGSDYHALGHHAAGQFLRRQHRQLAVLVPADDKAGHVATIAGFRAACRQVEGADIRVVQHDGTPAGIQRCLATMVKNTPPTGLLVAMPKYALAVMTFLTSIGVRVPQDISIIARDSEAYLDFMVPSFARYVVDTPLFMRKLSRIVIAMARGGSAPARDQLLLMPDFVAGETLDYLSNKNTSGR